MRSIVVLCFFLCVFAIACQRSESQNEAESAQKFEYVLGSNFVAVKDKGDPEHPVVFASLATDSLSALDASESTEFELPTLSGQTSKLRWKKSKVRNSVPRILVTSQNGTRVENNAQLSVFELAEPGQPSSLVLQLAPDGTPKKLRGYFWDQGRLLQIRPDDGASFSGWCEPKTECVPIRIEASSRKNRTSIRRKS